MSILIVLVVLGFVLLGAAVAAFFWAVGNGQFDDLDGPGSSVLDEHQSRQAPLERGIP